MKSVFSNAFLIAGLAFSVAFLSSGCRKKKDTIAKIYVLDDANQPVASCAVTLRGVSTEDKQSSVSLSKTAQTNSKGEAVFNFNEDYKLGMNGVAVLNIEAKKNDLKGTGMIKIEEEATNTERVFIH